MSHKYYGFKKQEEDLSYTIPFLSTKTKRLRFLNEEFVGYGEKNEFFIHKNPGLTIVRLTDTLVNNGLHNQSNTSKIMTEFLNKLIHTSNYSVINKTSKKISIKEVKVNSTASLQLTLKSNY